MLLRLSCWFAAFLSPAFVIAQQLAPNGTFSTGATNPDGWRLEGKGSWMRGGDAGDGAILIEGAGNSSGVWRSDSVTLTPGGAYRLRYALKRRSGSGGGTVMSGVSRVNRDVSAGEAWQTNQFFFCAPSQAIRDHLRLGQWHMNGAVLFDNVELHPALVSHSRNAEGVMLGEAERIENGIYHFNPNLGWEGANYHRTLVTNGASFNSDRWMFSPGAAVVYRVGASGIPQQRATLQVSINHYVAGTLLVEASLDGTAWQPVGEFGKERRSGTIEMPAWPRRPDEVFVRLRVNGANASLQVNRFDYQASLDRKVSDFSGETHFLVVHEQSPSLTVALNSVRLTNGNAWAIDCTMSNRTGENMIVSSPSAASPTKLDARQSQWIKLISPATRTGRQSLPVTLRSDSGQSLFRGEVDVDLYFLDDPRSGYWISDSSSLDVWWCESGWKIGRERGAPGKATARAVTLSAAGGEDEPVQIVLTPKQDLQITAATIPKWRGHSGKEQAIEVKIDEVAYVSVTHTTDGTGKRALHPDPLPPLKLPLQLRAGENQPLWLTFRVPRGTPAGSYTNVLKISTAQQTLDIPMVLNIHGFDLPRETHLRSAFGLGSREINRYHRLEKQADKEAVYEKYLKNFAEHRISPYSFSDFAPIDVRFTGEGTNKQARVDFTKFDRAAEKWLGEGGFSTFQLRLRGMGGGTFHSRSLGSLEGFQEGSSEHARLFRDYLSQVENHLRARGWLDNAFTYWFDEPDPKDYQFVIDGMQRIKAAAPGIKRMLTEQPEPSLLGHVDIWCGLTPEWTPEKVRARRAAGEQVWWYLCTGPKAPYVTIFIDHPGTEMRLWAWQSWQYGAEGLLVWASTYWTSGAAFPAPKLQDPWSDPMSYVSGYDFKPGHVGYWGNGDGRFVYPPRRNPNEPGEPVLDGPINSVRWENLRDGVEDYEYFWLLKNGLDRVRKTAPKELVAETEQLLIVPPSISKHLTEFTTDPRPMLEHRERIARTIEKLAAVE